MKNSKIMSVMKYFCMATLGIVFALYTIIAPKFNVKADSDTSNEWCELVEETDGKCLYVFGNVQNTVGSNQGGIILPSGVDKTQVDFIRVRGSAVFPANSKYLFDGFTKVKSIDLSNANTASVTNMSYMFNDCRNMNVINLSSFDTSKVTAMTGMFQNCSNLQSLNISTFTVSQIIDTYESQGGSGGNVKTDHMDYMFKDCSKLSSIIVNSSWSVDSSVAGLNMFDADYSLVGGNGTVYDSSNIHSTYARIDSTGYPGYLSTSNSLTVYGELTTNGGRFQLDISFHNISSGFKTYTITYGGKSETIELKGLDDIAYFEISVPAKELNTAKSLVITSGEDTLFSKDISAADYLRRLYKSADTNTAEGQKNKNMAGIILRYGAAAQLFFDPSLPSTSLANYGLDDTGYVFNNFEFKTIPPSASSYAIDASALNTALANLKLTYAGINLSLDGEVMFMMALKLPQGTDYATWAATSAPADLKSALSSFYNTSVFGDPVFVSDGSGKYVIVETNNINILNLETTIYSSAALGSNISGVGYIANSAGNSGSTEKQVRVCRALYDFYYFAKTY